MSLPILDLSAARNDACALNNVGVTMMMHGEFDSAVTSLKESLHIMRMILAPNASPESVKTFSNKKLRAASCIVSKMVKDDAPRTVSVRALESNDFQSLLHASFSKSCPSSVFHAILIRNGSSAGDECDQPDLDRTSNLMLLNYGLACFLLSMYGRPNANGRRRSAFSSIGYKTLLMSYTYFSSSQEIGDAQDLEQALYAAILLSYISLVLESSNEQEKSIEAKELQQGLLSAVEKETLIFQNQSVVAAAA